MRTFIAIELPKEIKDFLTRLQEQLKTSQADVKWVEPQNIHLTLKFLGEIDDKKLEQINKILEDIAKSRNPFYIRLSSMGAFPKTNYPRVIWVGIDKGDNETKEIAKALEEKIAGVAIPAEDRPFSSHITIGRTKSGLNRERLIKNLGNLTNNFKQEACNFYESLLHQSANASLGLEFSVTKITLFKSTLTPKGPIYEILKKAELKD